MFIKQNRKCVTGLEHLSRISGTGRKSLFVAPVTGINCRTCQHLTTALECSTVDPNTLIKAMSRGPTIGGGAAGQQAAGSRALSLPLSILCMYLRQVGYNLFMLFSQDFLYFLVNKLKQILKIKQSQKVMLHMVRCPSGVNKDA